MPRRKTHEEFVAEVRALVGDDFTVVGTYENNNTYVDITHNICGQTKNRLPRIFLGNPKCNLCATRKTAKSKRTPHTELLKEIERINKNEYELISSDGARKLLVRHVLCSHEFPTTMNSIRRGRGCPLCSGCLRKDTSYFKKEVRKLVGIEYEVVGEYINSQTNIEFKHIICGEIYPATPNNFLKGNRCPRCFESKGERKIREWLIDNGIIFNSQEPIKYDTRKRPLKLDFYVQGVAIEYDGEYHYKPMPHAGGEEGLRDQQHRDAIKDKYCADNGIPLIRIPYWEYDNIDAILTEKLLPLLNDSNAKMTESQAS